MGKLLKYLRMYWKAVLLIFAVLFVQAYCDLSLPSYTSDIVNVGIQQGGIDGAVPQAIAEKDMNRVLLFVTDESDRQTVTDAYKLDKNSYNKTAFILKESVEEDDVLQKELTDILGLPMLLAQGFSSDSEETQKIEAEMKEKILEAQTEAEKQKMQQLPEGMTEEQLAQLQGGTAGAEPDIESMDMFEILEILPEEQMEMIVDEIHQKMDGMPDMIVKQAAISYVKTSYENLDMDVDAIQIRYILSTGGKMIALAFLGMMASVLVGFLASRVAASAGRDLRSNVFRKVVGFSNHEFDHFSTASLITRSTNDIQQIQLLMVMLLRIVLYAPIMAVGGVYKVFQTNVSMSWIIGLGVVLIGLVVLTLFVVAMPKFKIMQKLVDRLNLVTREILTGLQVIRAFSTEKHEEERFDKANRDLTRTNLFVNRAMTFMMPVMMIIMNAISVLIVWVGANGINDGQMQVGDMMAFIQYTMQIIMSFLMICMISIMLPRAAVAAERVDEVLTSETLIYDPEEPEQFPEKADGVLKFEHVSFRYPGADEDVLHDITFEAKPGETTAIIGSTGSGKSTMVNLIPRFYDVTEGAITLDGIDIRQLAQHELRDRLGYVPQKGVLFSGNIASNIMFGNVDGTEEEMKEAAEIAQAAEFIETKHKRYESSIAQGGTNVSGGQKQRLSIARAIAKQPDIFIFDDSFSALDYKTDVALRSALKKRTADSTVLIVAQRISTILHAEQIIVLDDGEVAGIGTHQELLKNCEVYRQIAESQLSEAELEAGLKNAEQAADENRKEAGGNE